MPPDKKNLRGTKPSKPKSGRGAGAQHAGSPRIKRSVPEGKTKVKSGKKDRTGANVKTTATTRSSSDRRRTGASKASEAFVGQRIAKVIARAGLCSRREAERWIADGRVKINGRILNSPAYDINRGDRIEVDGALLPDREPVRLWRYHKPKGLVTTHRDPQGRATVFDALPDDLPRVISVGRLDFNTEGLLLLTNDGELARHLELPATGWLRRYRVRAHGKVTQEHLDGLSDGITVEGVRYGPIVAALDSVLGSNLWLTIGLREGKNREVRRVLAALGLEVNRLIRVSYGPFQLLDLKPKTVEPVRRKTLADQLGPKLTEQFDLSTTPDSATNSSPARPRPQAKRAKAGRGNKVSSRGSGTTTKPRSTRTRRKR